MRFSPQIRRNPETPARTGDRRGLRKGAGHGDGDFDPEIWAFAARGSGWAETMRGEAPVDRRRAAVGVGARARRGLADFAKPLSARGGEDAIGLRRRWRLSMGCSDNLSVAPEETFSGCLGGPPRFYFGALMAKTGLGETAILRAGQS